MSLKVFLVKPHPPTEIRAQKTPIPEGNRYNWEPVSLKTLAFGIVRDHGDNVDLTLWHLMDEQDNQLFEEALSTQRPDMVVFSEIDVLVNEVSRLAQRAKSLLPECWTVVGGKQTSLLQSGDLFPFKGIDYAIRGDGSCALSELVSLCRQKQPPSELQGLVYRDVAERVREPVTYAPRSDLTRIPPEALHSIRIENHSLNDYIAQHQCFPSLHTVTRTASILSGTGCPYRCSFCQSPVEYGTSSTLVKKRLARDIAKEVLWFLRETEANHFFLLEPNLDLRKLVEVYRELENERVLNLSITGFVRAGDVVSAHRAGFLSFLTERGLRVLSIGLDIPPDSQHDIYGKSFSYTEMKECLEICCELGILVLGTFVGSPDLSMTEYKHQLTLLEKLPLAVSEIRLAMALRNTDYFRQNEQHLIHHPEHDPIYFDRQNYRYQTLQFAGKITPEETYEATRAFYQRYLMAPAHLDYVSEMMQQHPDTKAFFRTQYQAYLDAGVPMVNEIFATTEQEERAVGEI